MTRPMTALYGVASVHPRQRCKMKRSCDVQALPAAALLLILLITPTFAAAQPNGERPTLSGTVLDPSGAIISRPVVVIRDESSGLEQVADGAADGSFSVARLPPGRYVVSASAPGFAVTTRTIDLPTADVLRIVLSPASDSPMS